MTTRKPGRFPTKFKSYNDSQHGWVAVKRVMLVRMGIAEKITRFSYQRGATVYLEGDCDLSLFVETYEGLTGHKPIITEGGYTNGSSRIRNYERYSFPKGDA